MKRRKFRGGLGLLLCGLLAAVAVLLTDAAAATPESPSTAGGQLVRFDLRRCLDELPADDVLRYDAMYLVSALQGLVNWDAPRLFTRYLYDVDDFWFDYAREVWLTSSQVEEMHSLPDLLRRFSPYVQGLVLWDPNVPATSNLAATICGVEGWLPARAGSPLFSLESLQGLWPDVKVDLRGKFTGAVTGSAKCDAYVWARDHYLSAGKCHPSLMAYMVDAFTQRPGEPGVRYPSLDNSTLANRDYYIAEKAFFMDLNVWPDETPVDDPGQRPGLDREILCSILKAQYERNEGKCFTTVGGFIPWDQKYTNHGLEDRSKHEPVPGLYKQLGISGEGRAFGNHDPVPTEWEYAAILSAHNAVMDADALGLVYMGNASAWRHFPLRERYEQNPPPPLPDLEQKTYVLIYMGDYDSAAWLQRHVPAFFRDPARGRVPIGWAFNPNLADRAPIVFDYVYRHKSALDWFIAGDSGAGYLNPNLLVGDRLGSGLPDALDLWVAHNTRYYQRFGYTITGFVINGFHGKMPLRIQEAYSRFSPDGVGMQLGFDQPLVNGTPFLRHTRDIYPQAERPEAAADEMRQFLKGEKLRFVIYRWILQSPTMLETVSRLCRERHPE
ncbi:MAG TPA: GxGYxYP family putative glycoside hydrolase, partial [Candidatus Hydrogenedentes bacterium]|nr:GxGYxYP family putative glycoside hydrolase [Candidatus Hydrogenedentota bacterium]